MKSIKINPKKIQEFDVVILVTDHDKFNYKILRKYSNLLVDTRGMIKKITLMLSHYKNNIVALEKKFLIG